MPIATHTNSHLLAKAMPKEAIHAALVNLERLRADAERMASTPSAQASYDLGRAQGLDQAINTLVFLMEKGF